MTYLQRDQLNHRGDFYASDHLLCDLRLAATDSDLEHLVNFAYTDYGGTFLDKVCIDFFVERYPDYIVVEDTYHFGKNAFLFGEVARAFREATQNYPLGFPGLEDYYNERAGDQELEDFGRYLVELSGEYLIHVTCFAWLSEHKAGYYGLTPQGVDFSYNDLTEELLAAGQISPLDDDQENINLQELTENLCAN